MESGVYKILCKANNKFYIGSSKDLYKRWREHLYNLRKNKHINIHLQRSFNKYGEDSFNFEVVELCDISSILVREQFYIDTLSACDNGFNISKKSLGGDNITDNPNKEDIIRRIKSKISQNLKLMLDEEKKEKWSRPGESNPNYGNRWNDEMKKEASDKNKGKAPINKGKTNIELLGEEESTKISKKLSDHASKRVGDKNPFFGKQHSEESKDKIRNERLGKYHGSQNIRIVIDGVLYNSYSEASKSLGIPIVTIRWRCLSKNSKFINYQLDNSPFIAGEDS